MRPESDWLAGKKEDQISRHCNKVTLVQPYWPELCFYLGAMTMNEG
jgi:hypothetical protein